MNILNSEFKINFLKNQSLDYFGALDTFLILNEKFQQKAKTLPIFSSTSLPKEAIKVF